MQLALFQVALMSGSCVWNRYCGKAPRQVTSLANRGDRRPADLDMHSLAATLKCVREQAGDISVLSRFLSGMNRGETFRE